MRVQKGENVEWKKEGAEKQTKRGINKSVVGRSKVVSGAPLYSH